MVIFEEKKSFLLKAVIEDNSLRILQNGDINPVELIKNQT